MRWFGPVPMVAMLGCAVTDPTRAEETSSPSTPTVGTAPSCPPPAVSIPCDSRDAVEGDLEWVRGCTDVSGSIHVGPESDITPLADLASVDFLEVHGSHDLSYLSELRQVRYLLTLDGALLDPGALGCLDVSPSLTLQGLERADLRGLPTRGVTRLVVSGTQLTSLAGPSFVETGASFELSNNPLLIDLGAVADVTEVDTFQWVGPGRPDLRGFERLNDIERLEILDANGLSFDGLQSVQAVGTLTVGVSDHLVLDGLSGLRTIRDDLSLLSNGPGVRSVGLSALEVVEGNVSLEDNEGLTHIDDFPALQRVGGTVRVVGHEWLEEVTGFEALVEAPSWFVTNNPRLRSFGGLPLLEEVDTVEFTLNPSLAELDLDVRTVRERLVISDSALTELTTLEELEIVGELMVSDNRSLGELLLPELTAAGVIQLFDDTALVTVSMPKLADGAGGYGNVDTYDGAEGPQLAVVYLPDLEVLSVPALTEAGSVVLDENFDYDLSGLESLERVGRLTINGTSTLTDLEVLDALQEVGMLEVRYNQRLCQSVIDAWVGERVVEAVDAVGNGDC